MPVKAIKNRFKTIDEAVVFLAESQAKSDAKMAESKAYLEKKIAVSEAKIAEFDAKKAESEAKIAEFDTKRLEKKIAESEAKIAEFDAKRAESEAKIAEFDAKSAEYQAKTDSAIQRLTESQAKTDSAIQRLTESQAKTDLAIQRLTESQDETRLAIKELTKNVNDLTTRVGEVLTGFSTVGNRFGELVELLVVPGLRRAINKYNNHDFKRSIANKSFYYIGRNGQKQQIAEVDLLLTDGTEIMAVEVKATLRRDYVDNHLKRLKKLREFAKETKLENKQLYGAIVGVYIDNDARKLAEKNGLYIIDILEEEKKLNVVPPSKVHVW